MTRREFLKLFGTGVSATTLVGLSTGKSAKAQSIETLCLPGCLPSCLPWASEPIELTNYAGEPTGVKLRSVEVKPNNDKNIRVLGGIGILAILSIWFRRRNLNE